MLISLWTHIHVVCIDLIWLSLILKYHTDNSGKLYMEQSQASQTSYQTFAFWELEYPQREPFTTNNLMTLHFCDVYLCLERWVYDEPVNFYVKKEFVLVLYEFMNPITFLFLTLKVLVATIDAKWEGMGDVGSARYEPALLPPCPTIRVLSYSN